MAEMRRITVALALVVACSAYAQRVPAPHHVFVDGADLGVLVGFDGGFINPLFEDGSVNSNPLYEDVELKYVPTDNDTLNDFFKKLCSSPKSNSLPLLSIVSPRDPQSGLSTGRSLFAYWPHRHQFALPRIDKTSNDDPDPVQVSFSPLKLDVARTTQRFGSGKQKSWLPANFRLSIGNLPCRFASTASACTLSIVEADLDGDGLLDQALHLEPFTFTVPFFDAQPFLDQLALTKAGTPVEMPFSYTITNGGNPVATVTSSVVITGAQDVNLFPPDGMPGMYRIKASPFGKSKELTGHVTLIK